MKEELIKAILDRTPHVRQLLFRWLPAGLPPIRPPETIDDDLARGSKMWKGIGFALPSPICLCGQSRSHCNPGSLPPPPVHLKSKRRRLERETPLVNKEMETIKHAQDQWCLACGIRSSQNDYEAAMLIESIAQAGFARLKQVPQQENILTEASRDTVLFCLLSVCHGYIYIYLIL